MKVEEGITYGTDDRYTQIMQSGWSLEGHPANYDTLENVERVKSVFPASKFNDWLPNADQIYTYDSFLKAVAKYPAFCGEHNESKGLTAETACKREVSAFFAIADHVSDELK